MATLERTKTHRLVKKPQITARYLADYMAASERARRTIIRGCKFQPLARVMQHDEAKLVVSKSIWEANQGAEFLTSESCRIRNKLADSDFDRDTNDLNADYVARFAKVRDKLALPEADFAAPGRSVSISINGVKVNIELHARLSRRTRTNKIKTGAATLRYAKGKPLAEEIGLWQSAFLFGYLQSAETAENTEPEQKLCLTIDAYTGNSIAAPTDSISRFRNMEAACATIAERWENIEPPEPAVL